MGLSASHYLGPPCVAANGDRWRPADDSVTAATARMVRPFAPLLGRNLLQPTPTATQRPSAG